MHAMAKALIGPQDRAFDQLGAQRARVGIGDDLVVIAVHHERRDREFLKVWSCPGSVDSLSSSFLDLVFIDLNRRSLTARSAGRSSEGIF
jgi:hypothetical protein